MFEMVVFADSRCLLEPHLGGLGVAAGTIDIAIVVARIAGVGRQDLGFGREGAPGLPGALEFAFSSVAAGAGAARL